MQEKERIDPFADYMQRILKKKGHDLSAIESYMHGDSKMRYNVFTEPPENAWGDTAEGERA